MPDVWLIRHAPAAGNVVGTFMGRLDGAVQEDGLAAAAALAGTIEAGMVRSSPLRRAALTAAAIFPDHTIAIDDRLAERDLGTWQGRAKADVRAEQPDAFTAAGTCLLYTSPSPRDS